MYVFCTLEMHGIQGVTYPAMAAMLGIWSPPLESSMMSTIALSGMYICI